MGDAIIERKNKKVLGLWMKLEFEVDVTDETYLFFASKPTFCLLVSVYDPL